MVGSVYPPLFYDQRLYAWSKIRLMELIQSKMKETKIMAKLLQGFSDVLTPINLIPDSDFSRGGGLMYLNIIQDI